MARSWCQKKAILHRDRKFVSRVSPLNRHFTKINPYVNSMCLVVLQVDFECFWTLLNMPTWLFDHFDHFGTFWGRFTGRHWRFLGPFDHL